MELMIYHNYYTQLTDHVKTIFKYQASKGLQRCFIIHLAMLFQLTSHLNYDLVQSECFKLFGGWLIGFPWKVIFKNERYNYLI